MRIETPRWGSRRPRQFDVAFFMPQIGEMFATDPGRGVAPGGAEVQISMLARELARRGVRVAVVALEPGPAFRRVVDGVHVIAISTRARARAHGYIGKIGSLVKIVRLILSLRTRVLVQRNADLITGVLALLASLGGYSFAYSSANVIDFDFGDLEPNRVKVRLYELGVSRAAHVIVQTAEQVDLCGKRFHRSSTLIRSIAEPAPSASQPAEAFLWVGRLTGYKRPDVLIELARRLPESRFRMVAPRNRNDPPALVEMVEAAGRELPNLELLPSRPRAELGALIDTAVAVINTSEYEGMSNVILEAWARGVPAVTFSHDPDNLIEHRGLGVCAHGEIERLVDATRLLWNQRHGATRPCSRCIEYVELEHSLTNVATEWIHELGLEATCAA
jgi:glycosyltransferase involved in cell wall biosynthesis